MSEKLEETIRHIIEKPVPVLNATVGKPYETLFDFKKFGGKDIRAFEFSGLEEVGLRYDIKTKLLTGMPIQSGDLKIILKFKVEGEAEDTPFNEKVFTLIINPDPKTLWKNLESDKDDPYWKQDDVTMFSPIGDRHILVSSKRGRSHANVGSFREDDFAFKDLHNGWSIIAVADGAGSAKVSRKGSEIACESIVNYFLQRSSIEEMLEVDDLMLDYDPQSPGDIQNKLNLAVYNNLGKAVFTVHKQLEEFAKSAELSLKDLSSTLVFTLYKKFDQGYVFLSFGVGDCPMAVLSKDVSEVTQLTWIDVGDFGGGTRFITMPEIFKSEKFASRFSFKLLKDFSYLMLMSDGIYDAKLVVEANLADIKKWKAF
ncbi:MAG: PP2C family serine/threonine-protein phosphatase, partial [Ginsengibacter sp.]